MKRTKVLAGIAVSGAALMAMAGTAQATAVVCGNLTLGTRTITIDPGLGNPVGSSTPAFCFTQNGNLDNPGPWATYAAANGIAEVDKDTTTLFPTGDNSEGALQFTRTTDVSGEFSFLESLWDTWDRLFIGFHFGGGGDQTDTNPDSFVVELEPRGFLGTYARNGGTSQALSNIYLFGVRCTNPNGCNPPDENVPEPGTLALLGLGLLGLGASRRRVK